MNAIKVETVIQSDGELHFTNLPFRVGDRIEAIFLVLEENAKSNSLHDLEAEKKREEALRSLLALADASQFRSTGPYPTRDELHERR